MEAKTSLRCIPNHFNKNEIGEILPKQDTSNRARRVCRFAQLSYKQLGWVRFAV